MVKNTVTKNEAGQRFDKLIMKQLKEAPASFVYKMLRKKNITLNGKKADGTEKVSVGDEICYFLSDETYEKFAGSKEMTSKASPLIPSLRKEEIIYEDSDLLIANKPVGELSQKAEVSDISINERIVSYLTCNGQNNGEAFTPGICNRIDRNTSGLIVAGKSLQGLQDAAELLRKHSLKKYYLCVVKGEIKSELKIKAWLSKDQKTNKVEISEQPREDFDKIEAEYYSLAKGKGYSLLAVRLITGKPHQIRAHLAYLGNPLAGDLKYGFKPDELVKLRHQLLHAFMLIFPEDCLRLKEVSGKSVVCMPPSEFLKVCDKLFDNGDYKNAILEFQRTQGFKP